jgi:short-subunit dehydrogenase
MITHYQNKVIWIIGASSGIGAALAQELDSHGAILALSARRSEELKKLKESLKGSQHEILVLDVTNAESLTMSSCQIIQKFGRLDSVIFLAAAYTPMILENLDIVNTQQIIEVNMLGAFNVLFAVLPIFKKQIYGQIALCASIAGYIGLPGGQPYSATKAGIINLAESLRAELPKYIDVKLINPGFVRTQLTDKNKFNMPMIISPQQAAVFISKGLLSKSFEIHFPKKFTLWIKLLRLLPYNLLLKILSKIPYTSTY